MFGIGMPELILILAIALIVIGPKKLPDLAKSLGRAMREFKKATSELKGSLELESEIKEVKGTFEDIQSDIKHSVLEDRPQAGDKKGTERKGTDLEKGDDTRQKERSSDPVEDEIADPASPSETAAAPPSTNSDAPRPDDASEKDH